MEKFKRKKSHFKFGTDRDTEWHISVADMWWNEVSNKWEEYTPEVDMSSTHTGYKGKMTNRRIGRILRKWNLPAGSKVWFLGECLWKNRGITIPVELFEVNVK